MKVPFSIRWLIIEFIVAKILCWIPVLWAGVLDEHTLQQGMIVAMAFIIPSEIFRQLVPKEATLRIIQNKINLFIGIFLFVLGGPAIAIMGTNWLNIIHYPQVEIKKPVVPLKILTSGVTPSIQKPEKTLPVVNPPIPLKSSKILTITPKPQTPNKASKVRGENDTTNSYSVPSFVAVPNQNKVNLEFKGLKKFYYGGEKLEVDLLETGSRSQSVDLWFAIQTPDKSLIFVPLNALNSLGADNEDFFEDKNYAKGHKLYASSVQPQTTVHSKIIDLQIPSEELLEEPISSEELFFTQWGGKGNYKLHAVYIEEGKNPIVDGEEYFRSNLVKQTFTWLTKGATSLAEQTSTWPTKDITYKQPDKTQLQRKPNINVVIDEDFVIEIKRYINESFLRITFTNKHKRHFLLNNFYRYRYKVADEFNLIRNKYEYFNSNHIEKDDIIIVIPFKINMLKISEYLSSKTEAFDHKLKTMKNYDTKDDMSSYIKLAFSEEETVLSCQLVLTTIEINLLIHRDSSREKLLKLKIEIFEDFLTNFSKQTKKNLSDVCYEFKSIDEWKKEFEKLIKYSN